MNNGLDRYLAAVAHEMRGLSEERRAAEMREIEQHLRALISRGVEAGAGEEEASAAALAQFGDARRVGRDLRRAHPKAETTFDVVLAPLAALSCHIALYMLGMCLMVAFEHMMLKGWVSSPLHSIAMRLLWWNPWVAHWSSDTTLPAYTLLSNTNWLLQVLLQPFLAGLLTARIAPRSAVAGVACLYLAIALLVWSAGPPNEWKFNLLAINFSVCFGSFVGARRALPRQLKRA
jgi:hypothetical protein